MKYFLFLLLLSPQLIFAGELADLFIIQQKTSKYPDLKDDKTARKNTDIEIGLERTSCYGHGKCPEYTIIIKGDGSLTYTGFKYVKKLGVHTGKVLSAKLSKTLQFLKGLDYASLKNNYDSPASDYPATYTLVKTNGQSKVIYNYANSGPAKLNDFEALIDNLIDSAEWDE